jgi:hypothetical protein
LGELGEGVLGGFTFRGMGSFIGAVVAGRAEAASFMGFRGRVTGLAFCV